MNKRQPSHAEFKVCPRCGEVYDAQYSECPHCTQSMQLNGTPFTRPLNRPPTVVPGSRYGTDHLQPNTVVVLQAIPSGTCITLSTHKRTILGREGKKKIPPDAEMVLLDDLDAPHHGVSRQHCLIERSGTQLWVTDLDSTNGTYLNEQSLEPFHPYVLVNGDRLILGTLHLAVFFERAGQGT